MMFLSPFRLFLIALFCGGVALLRFEKGAYTDVTVAFDRSLIRSERQLNNLKTLIQDASRELYAATQGLAYFKQVIIIKVTRDNEAPDIHENIIRRSRLYSRADIRIASTITEHGTPDAFTIQAGECGEQGKFILISDSLFRNLEPGNATKLAARRLVQEWVRYRYGVFGELPAWGEQSFMWKGKKISPATCADGIRGWAMTEYHERCVLDCERVRSNCRFFPDPKSNSSVESSLMSYPHMSDAKHFCNISTHNRKAPSMHNRMCNSKSIMEIIRKHEDFKDANRWLNKAVEEPPKKTDVKLVDDKRRYLDVVFAVEWSQRMKQVNGTQEVQDFIQRFLEHIGSKVAFIYGFTFTNETGENVFYSNKVLYDNLPPPNFSNKTVGTATPDINKALKFAYNIHKLFTYPHYLWNPKIFLISTGNGKFDKFEQYKSWDEREIATIHSISIGRTINWNLDYVSQLHGGDSYFVGDERSGIGEPRSFNLDMAFLASMHLTVDDNRQPLVISYERFTLKSKGERYNHYFQVDDPIGRNVSVTLSVNYIKYKLISPRQHPQPNKTHQYKFGSSAITVIVYEAEPGRWTLELWQEPKEEEQHVDVLITARPRSDVQGSFVWVHAWIANVTEDKKGNGTKGYHRIFAEVKRGYHPVIDATVIATVQIMDQTDPIKVTLRDNGAAPDVFKDDGIYSNFFPVTIRAAGRPIVIVRVSNDGGKAWVKTHWNNWKSTYGMLDDDDYKRAMKEFGDSKSGFSEEDFTRHSRCKEWKEADRICALYLPLPFERVAMTNSPILFNLSEDEVHRTPPAVIRDLKVVMEFIREGEYIALLQWTSPEHPRPNTKVSKIEVRGSTDHNLMLLKKFTSANIIHTIKNISPTGDVQRLEFNISKDMVTVNGRVHNMYFALRAEDQDGNVGEMSNIAEAFFERFEEKMEAAKGKGGIRSWILMTVGGLLVVVVVIVVVGAMGYLMWKKRNKGRIPNATETFELKESKRSR